jgi:acyl-CoA synthetase
MTMNRVLSLQDVTTAREYYAKGYWQDETFYTLLRKRAQSQPDKYLVRDTNSRLSYRAALEWVDALAESLHAAGVREGDRVSIWLPSRVESALILMACARMGYVCNTSLHRDNTCEEVVELLKRAGTVAFFAQPGYGADAGQRDIFDLANQMPQMKRVYTVPPLRSEAGDGDEETRFSGLKRLAKCDLAFSKDPDRVFYLAFTSGTTGQPKGVMHSSNTVLANARDFVKDWRFNENTVLYTVSPMSHNIGTVGLANMLTVGGELVVHTPFDAKRVLDRIIETGATSAVGVPTHGIDVLTAARQRGLKKIGNLTNFQVGGATVPPALIQGLMEVGIKPKNGFGMTENCSFNYTRPDDPPELIVNSCGRCSPCIELRIWDQDNTAQEMPRGEVGELGVRGACLMLGYFNDQAATERSFNRDGWFLTGDLGVQDEAGNLRIVGRKKDLIIRGGHNIHPSKIEDLTMRHSNVIKAAAFSVADERLGEKVCLAIVPKHKNAMTGDEMLRHLDAQGLSKFDMPEYFIEMETFPLTASGKILKRGLIDLVAEGKLKPEAVRFKK